MRDRTVTYPKIRRRRMVVVARKVQRNWLSIRLGVSLCKADNVSDRAEGYVPVVRTQACVRYRPLAERIVQGLVVPPFNRIPRVVQSHLEILGTTVEKVPVSRELAGIARCVVV